MAAVAADREEQLAWEARQRPRAGVAALVAALLSVAGFLWGTSALNGAPKAWFLQSLANAAADGPIGERPSVRSPGFQFFVDNSLGIVGSGVLRALGLIALAWAVTFLAAATRARRTEFARIAVYVTLFGAVLLSISYILIPAQQVLVFQDFLDGSRTVDEASELGGSLYITAQLIGFIGQFTLAAGVLLVSLNAMRAGLLTRFIGILGVIAGILLVLPQLAPVPIVMWVWLAGIGMLMLGTGRAGLLPAWRTGNAEPWPTATEAAQRRREAEERRQGIEPKKPQPTQARATPTGRPHPSSKKRKRKRRD